jgi:hypothetical protein
MSRHTYALFGRFANSLSRCGNERGRAQCAPLEVTPLIGHCIRRASGRGSSGVLVT